MKCNKCNNELGIEAKFCGTCGQEVAPETKTTSEQNSGITPQRAISTIVLVLAIFLGRYLMQGSSPSSTNYNSILGNYSKTELVNETVKQVKSKTTFPSKLDSVTTAVDVTAEQNAIRYHYVLSGVDTSKVSNAYLKNYIGSSMCQNKGMKYLLDRGVNIEYSYVVENTTQNYFVTLTKADCSQ